MQIVRRRFDADKFGGTGCFPYLYIGKIGIADAYGGRIFRTVRTHPEDEKVGTL